MSLSGSERIRLFYGRFQTTDQVLVVINADPDAIACALAVKRLLWKKVAGVTIAHINVIDRPDNLAMVRLLGVKLVHIDTVDTGRFSRFVLVDSQPEHNERLAGLPPADVVIDHHPAAVKNAAAYTDIRPDYGATATILTEYLKAARIKPSQKLATGLYLGIKTDTSNFERHAAMEDVRAFQYIFRYVNIHLARKIEQAEIKPEFLAFFSRALERKVMRNRKIFAHLGRVTNPDVCVIVADFFMRVSSVQWSIVSGIYDNRLVVILRNDGARRDAGRAAKKAFESMGSAGGHKSMARAEIPLDKVLGVLKNKKDDREMSRWIIGKLR
ncbi:MAG: DHH family phosphoesterase [Thermodesulfobacteriota bacterium]